MAETSEKEVREESKHNEIEIGVHIEVILNSTSHYFFSWFRLEGKYGMKSLILGLEDSSFLAIQAI